MKTFDELQELYEKALNNDAQAMYEFACVNRCFRSELMRHISSAEQEFEFLNKSADMEFPLAYASVGLRYLWGEGVERDYKQAVCYFRQAFNSGYEDWIPAVKNEIQHAFRRSIVNNGEDISFMKLQELLSEIKKQKLNRELGENEISEATWEECISNYIAQPQNKVLVVLFSNSDDLDIVRRRLENSRGCSKFQERPSCNNKYAWLNGDVVRVCDHPELTNTFILPSTYSRDKTKFFLYHSYVDQLSDESMDYCFEVLENTHLPVICMVDSCCDSTEFSEEDFLVLKYV